MTIRYKDGEWYKVRDGFYGRDFLLFTALDGKYISYLPEGSWHCYKTKETDTALTDVDIEEEGALAPFDPRDSSRGWVILYDGTQERDFNEILSSALYGNHMIALQGGTERDDKRAFSCLSISPLAKDKFRTAQMYKKGRGVLKDLMKAYSYCLDAASKNYGPAMDAIERAKSLLKSKKAKA